MSILILSRSENVHADMVEEYCRKHVPVTRINFDFEKQQPKSLPKITCGTEIPVQAYNAVFVHHPRISYKDEWFTDAIERRLFVASWDSVKEWLESQLPNATWTNRPSANVSSRNILGQLYKASNIGFAIPPSIFTNQLDVLKNFAGAEDVVIKQGNLGTNIEGKRILTSPIDIKSLTEEMLSGCPCLFQKYISKQFELRIHVIGNTVLTCKIDSQKTEHTKIDWRNYDLDNTPHEAYTLDDATRNKCITLVRNLGLSFGIIDMIVTPSDGYVFLECNAQGHWAWIEKLTGLPITNTLCKHLLNHSSV